MRSVRLSPCFLLAITVALSGGGPGGACGPIEGRAKHLLYGPPLVRAVSALEGVYVPERVIGRMGHDDDEPQLELTPAFELVVPKPKLPSNRKKGQLGVSAASSKSPDLVSLVFVPELRAMFSGR